MSEQSADFREKHPFAEEKVAFVTRETRSKARMPGDGYVYVEVPRELTYATLERLRSIGLVPMRICKDDGGGVVELHAD